MRDNCLDFKLPEDNILWKLKEPSVTMQVSLLVWQFEIPFWKYGNKKYAITPRQVMVDPKKYYHHYRRIVSSDLSHPLVIIKNQTGKWEILDGLHRLAKAHLLGIKQVSVRKITYAQLTAARHTSRNCK